MPVSALTLSSPFADIRAIPKTHRSPFADPLALALLPPSFVPPPPAARVHHAAAARRDDAELASQASLRDWM